MLLILLVTLLVIWLLARRRDEDEPVPSWLLLILLALLVSLCLVFLGSFPAWLVLIFAAALAGSPALAVGYRSGQGLEKILLVVAAHPRFLPAPFELADLFPHVLALPGRAAGAPAADLAGRLGSLSLQQSPYGA